MPRILLVEDNEMNRNMLSRRLTHRGYEMIVATDGQGALKAFVDSLRRGDTSISELKRRHPELAPEIDGLIEEFDRLGQSVDGLPHRQPKSMDVQQTAFDLCRQCCPLRGGLCQGILIG